MVKVETVFTIEDEGKIIFQAFLSNGKTHIGDSEKENIPEVGMKFSDMETFYSYVEA